MAMPSPDTYPTLILTDITEDIIDAYYYLGEERIGCMDKKATNYLKTAVLDDESCVYAVLIDRDRDKDMITVSPQPAQSYAIIHFVNEAKPGSQEYNIYNVIGEKVYMGILLNGQKLTIDTSSWEAGVYYIQINMENRNLTYRFAVK